MLSYTKCKKQKLAIIEAKAFVKETGETAHVLLICGDTLTISESGSRQHSGWVRSGNIFCGPKAYAVAQ
jgi:hypothetical protein